jgi:hypothetical protein
VATGKRQRFSVKNMSPPNEKPTIEESEDSDDPQLTEIVAYLDGELSENDCLRLERQLATSPPLRGYAESLDRTWQLLDALGQTDVSDEFTHKTLASLTTVSGLEDAAAQKTSGGSLRWMAGIPRAKPLIWTLAGFIGAATGLQLAQNSRKHQADSEDVQLLRQLDLLENYPKMYPVPSAEFLKRLAALQGGLSPEDSTSLGVSQP